MRKIITFPYCLYNCLMSEDDAAGGTDILNPNVTGGSSLRDHSRVAQLKITLGWSHCCDNRKFTIDLGRTLMIMFIATDSCLMSKQQHIALHGHVLTSTGRICVIKYNAPLVFAMFKKCTTASRTLWGLQQRQPPYLSHPLK